MAQPVSGTGHQHLRITAGWSGIVAIAQLMVVWTPRGEHRAASAQQALGFPNADASG